MIKTSLKIRRVPWTNKAEWMSVFEKLAGGVNFEAYSHAAVHLKIWLKKGNCPPAVEYSYHFLCTMIRDPYFFREISDGETDANLHSQYATSLLRFVNVLGEVDSARSLSLNARALQLGLPEWVVNIRHQISHGTQLPSLDVLRVSVKALFAWLITNYWMVEKEALGDIVLPDRTALVQDYVGKLLKIYISLTKMRANSLVKTISDIKDPEITELLSNINRYLYHNFKLESSPWSGNEVPGLKMAMAPKKMKKLSLPKMISNIVQAIKLYCKYEDVLVSEVLARAMMNCKKGDEPGYGLWESLIVELHSMGKFPALLDRLFIEMKSGDLDVSKRAQQWILLLLQSLLKRSIVEKKLQDLTSEPLSKKIRLSLNEKEQKLLAKERMKNQVSQEVGAIDGGIDPLAGSFQVVERQRPMLKTAYRLKDAKFLEEDVLRSMLIADFTSDANFSLPIAVTLINLSNVMKKSWLPKMIKLLNLNHGGSVATGYLPAVDAFELNKLLRS